MAEKIWRVEGVGSLLRPAELIAARDEHAAGRLDASAFKKIEDRAVGDAIRLQEEIGLDVVSDGELRRRTWMSHLFDSFDGFELDGGVAMPWREHAGPPTTSDDQASRRPVVAERLRWRHAMCAEEWTFLRSHTARQGKATLASAEMAAAMYDEQRSRDAYPSREEYFAHIIELLRQEVAELARLGCTYIQLDAPQYGALTDPTLREMFRQRGQDPDAMIDAGVEMDNAIMAGFSGVTFGLHICRGNSKSRFYAEGGYDPVVRIFERSTFHRFLLEYDDERSGGFEPLSAVPDDRVVVLGLVTTKRPELEAEDYLERRINDAARFVPLERLALSPQCGFASVLEGNRITPAEQRAKLELVNTVAGSVWGSV